MELPELGERRLFVHTPTGILLELVFREGMPRPTAKGAIDMPEWLARAAVAVALISTPPLPMK